MLLQQGQYNSQVVRSASWNVIVNLLKRFITAFLTNTGAWKIYNGSVIFIGQYDRDKSKIYVKKKSNQSTNNSFYFDIVGKKIHVCKQFFMSTLCINDRTIQRVLQKKNIFIGNIMSSDLRGKHDYHHKLNEDIKYAIWDHINSIPCIPSHYCQAVMNNKYIEGGRLIADLHRNFEKACKENNHPVALQDVFSNI